MTTAAPEVLEAEVPAVLPNIGSAEVDMQITTAKRYPRSITQFKANALAMATLDEETAEACFYALPRGGKTIEGPSARLAEICLTAYGNMRVEARMVAEDERFVTSRGTAWDLQSNVAIAYEVKRRITTSGKGSKEAKRYDDDMIGVTSNAASSIALRNAVFKAIPAAFWRPIYLACRKAAVGDIKTLANRRASMLDHFQKMGATNAQVFALLGVQGADDITLDHMATLKGLATALKENETTLEEVFAAAPAAPIKPAERKSEQQQKPPAPESSQAPAAVTTEPTPTVTESTGQPATVGEATSGAAATVLNVGSIANITEHGEAIVVELNTGLKCSTKDAGIKQAARNLKESQRIVELLTTQNGDPKKFMPRLDEIIPMAAAE